MTEDEFHLAWCVGFFNMLSDQGVWAVPRSGLVFQRQARELVLIERMPFMPEMEGEITPEELELQQEADFITIRDKFKVAGIVVRQS